MSSRWWKSHGSVVHPPTRTRQAGWSRETAGGLAGRRAAAEAHAAIAQRPMRKPKDFVVVVGENVFVGRHQRTKEVDDTTTTGIHCLVSLRWGRDGTPRPHHRDPDLRVHWTKKKPLQRQQKTAWLEAEVRPTQRVPGSGTSRGSPPVHLPSKQALRLRWVWQGAVEVYAARRERPKTAGRVSQRWIGPGGWEGELPAQTNATLLLLLVLLHATRTSTEPSSAV